jgi:hypothetical protein
MTAAAATDVRRDAEGVFTNFSAPLGVRSIHARADPVLAAHLDPPLQWSKILIALETGFPVQVFCRRATVLRRRRASIAGPFETPLQPVFSQGESLRL